MKKLITLLVIPVLLLIACDSSDEVCADFPLADTTITDQEEYEIIDVILNEELGNSDLAHIFQKTHFMVDSSRFTLYFKDDELELESAIVEDYIEVNSKPFSWGDSFDTKLDLLTEEEKECLFDTSGWTGFYDKYPDSKGYLQFGKPVKNDEGKALVSFVHHCGEECSSGYTASLFNESGEWKVKKLSIVWIS